MLWEVKEVRVGTRYPKAKFSAQRGFICPKGTRAETKRPRQELVDQVEGDWKRGEGEGVCTSEGQNCFWIERRHTATIGKCAL